MYFSQRYFLILGAFIIFSLNEMELCGTELPLDASAKENREKFQPAKSQYTVNLNLKEETAVKIAETLLVSIYGEEVLKQRPWIVTDNGSEFKITGTFHNNLQYMPENADGTLIALYGEKSFEERFYGYKRIKNLYPFHKNSLFYRLGGVAEIIISKSDARVIKCIHGK